MAIIVRPHSEELTPAVSAFNHRLRSAGLPHRFPESPVAIWLPRIGERSIFQEFFLALDGEAVRGGYVLKHQPFLIGNETISIGHYTPISEGLIDRRFAGLGVQLLKDCLRRQPLLYWLGLGGMNQPLTIMMKAARWNLWSIPFYFRIVRPRTFLRNIEYLRKTLLRRAALDLLAFCGLGIALRGYQALKARASSGVIGELVPNFCEWSDAIWEAGRGDYQMAGVRDGQSLQILYRPDAPRFIRIRVKDATRDVGWAVCLNTAMQGDKSFGNMRLGSIIDCFARPEEAWKVIAAATAHLEAAGTDLIVSNQSHRAWRAAMEQSGYFSGPSNFVLAMSNKLCQRLDPFDAKKHEFHLTRGDGDGPIHL
jgi:hypothetical protein